MKKSFVVYKDRQSYIKYMTIEEKADFLDAMFFYQNNEWEYDYKCSAVRIVFWKILEVFEEDKKKREKKRESNSEAGKLGGLAKASKRYKTLENARKSKTPSNSYIYILYTNIDNIKNIFIKLLWEEFCRNKKNHLYILIDMIELWYKIQETKQDIDKNLQWIDETCKRFEIPTVEMQNKVFQWKTRHQNKQSEISNYKNSIYTFLTDKWKQKK